MRLFISWSGETSHKVACLLRERLPAILQGIEPWVSSVDIEKGGRWDLEIAKRLDDCNFGIVCVDPSNIQSPWLNFEAGALSKLLDEAHVAPFLVGLTPSEVSGPLSQFQMTTVSKDDVARLLESVNKAMGDNKNSVGTLRENFSLFWPALSDDLSEIEISTPKHSTPTNKSTNDEDISAVELAEARAKGPDETEIAFLKALADRIVGGYQQLVPVDVVAADISISPAGAKYHVNRLKEMGFVNFNPQGYPRLSDQGLAYLGSNKHLN